jgi:hypothetical protein
MAQTAKTISAKTWYQLGIGGAVAIMAVDIALLRVTHSPLVLWGLLSLAMLWGLGCIGQAWARIDEVAREAQKSSWFWGGSFGLLIALLAAATTQTALFGDAWTAFFAFLDANKGHWRLPQLSFLSGVMFACLAQVAGAGFGAIVWWARTR